MASKRMCPQSVTLYNYVGEVNRRATYVVTYLHNVKCIVYRGVSSSIQGRGEADTSKLYIFDDILYAANEKNEEVQYLPHKEWAVLDDKTGYWTLSPDGEDFYISDGEKFEVKGFKRLDQGSPRLVHFEVDGG